jgi:cobalt/nickel transport protein
MPLPWILGGGLGLSLLLAFAISSLASSHPDALESVLLKSGVNAAPSDGPLAGYLLPGVETPWLATGSAGVIGVVGCFAMAGVVAFGLRAWRRRSDARASR